ncbi:MAG: AMP-binding protein, partial [Bacteroidia bacterium]|nr:AMP-binding protein [Bacteroidia bacterium]
MKKPTRLFDILPYQLEKNPKSDALCMKVNGTWKKLSSQTYYDQVNRLSLALLKLGIRKSDKVAIISQNRVEWNIVDLAVLQLGAVDVPIYPTATSADYEYILHHSESQIVFVNTAEIAQKVQSVSSKLPHLKHIFSFEKIEGIRHWSDLIAEAEGKEVGELELHRSMVQPEDLATLVYTSGTTGYPKGVMLSHANLMSNIQTVAPLVPINSDCRALSFLPLCHVFERLVSYLYSYIGVSVYYAESMETIADNLKEVKPHFFTTVPRLLEKVYDKIVAKGQELTGIKKNLFFWALNLGLQYEGEGKHNFWYNMQLAIARKLIFSKWKEALGGNVIGIVSGAAALQPRLQKVFWAAGIPVLEGYGLSETSPVISVNYFGEGNYQFGTVGKVIPDVQVKIIPEP